MTDNGKQPAVLRYIEKFGKEVWIYPDHELAVAQDKLDAARATAGVERGTPFDETFPAASENAAQDAGHSTENTADTQQAAAPIAEQEAVSAPVLSENAPPESVPVTPAATAPAPKARFGRKRN